MFELCIERATPFAERERSHHIPRSSEEDTMAKAKNAVPQGFHTVTPQLTLENAAESIAWYVNAFGAEEVSRALGPRESHARGAPHR